MPNQQIDPQAKALAQAIREAESHGNFNAKGKSGEWGAYQFMPNTWTAYAQEAGVNAAFGSASPDQQNEVAYKKIKQWKDAGYNVGQIASMWNAGPGKPDAYKEGWKGVNSQGVQYDTPAYAEKVAQAYQRYKGEATLGRRDAPATQLTASGEKKTSLIEDMTKSGEEAGTKLATAWGDVMRQNNDPKNIGVSSGLIRTAGAAGGLIGDLATDVLHHTPVVGSIVKGAEDVVGGVARGVMESEPGQQAMAAYQRFAEKHPELAGNISAGADALTALPVLKGYSMAKSGIKGLVKGKTDDIVDIVSPKMTPKKTEQALLTRGTETKGMWPFQSTVLKPDPKAVKIGDVIKSGAVPGFDPGKSAIHNIAAIQETTRRMAQQLKQKVNEIAGDRIYSYRELAAALNRVDMPDVIAGDTYLSNLHNKMVARALEIAKKKGGKVPNLIDVRQEFDQMVKRQYPNIFNNAHVTSPLKATYMDLREALTKFTADNLPVEAGLRDSYLTQHLLITGAENMAKKASVSTGNELGLTAIDRFKGRHRTGIGAVKEGAKVGLQGLGLGGVVNLTN